MGQKHEMVCTVCTYSVLTSGGPDMGFLLETDTFVCQDCKQLTDVTISNQNSSPDPLKSIDRCGICSGINLIKWDHYTKPCPKCGGKMRVNTEGETYLWD